MNLLEKGFRQVLVAACELEVAFSEPPLKKPIYRKIIIFEMNFYKKKS